MAQRIKRVATFNEIKDLVVEDPLLTPETWRDVAHAVADKLAPFYYGDTLKTWDTLHMDDRNRWMDFGYEKGQTIFDLMLIDIYHYHYDLAHAVIKQIFKELD